MMPRTRCLCLSLVQISGLTRGLPLSAVSLRLPVGYELEPGNRAGKLIGGCADQLARALCELRFRFRLSLNLVK